MRSGFLSEHRLHHHGFDSIVNTRVGLTALEYVQQCKQLAKSKYAKTCIDWLLAIDTDDCLFLQTLYNLNMLIKVSAFSSFNLFCFSHLLNKCKKQERNTSKATVKIAKVIDIIWLELHLCEKRLNKKNPTIFYHSKKSFKVAGCNFLCQNYLMSAWVVSSHHKTQSKKKPLFFLAKSAFIELILLPPKHYF